MRIFPILCLSAACILSGCATSGAKPNQLTKAEEKSGWSLLFNGRDFQGWRLYKKSDAPDRGWQVEDGVLHLLPGSKPGDLVSTKKFENFDLTWEWKIAPKGNNGLKYLVSETRGAPGPEYQMIDDSIQPEPAHQTASFYYVFAPAANKPLHPAGEWNQSRVVVQGKKVEHWLNGKKVLTYEFESPELKAALAQSKFKNEPTFGVKAPGHIMLTDHHDEAWYRNIKIRELR